MAAELIPLNPDQHAITFVPKLTAELPFFNLTNFKRNLPQEIIFDGLDNTGRPIHWEVYPNLGRGIGAPGVEAHRVWYLLVKPAIDEARQLSGSIPEVIPLGRVRECLRKIGWTAGGRQERELIKALTQVSFAGCVADLWIPTKEVDAEGRPKFLQVKGRFSRMSVYAIGEHHLTEDELQKIAFDFDPDDIIYIKLDPLEARMQEAQDQRVYDNEYWFSVDPAARRWYELLAPKIFGTVKNKAAFCEIRYSWYVKHHHTLKRFYQRRQVVKQIQQVIKDHLESGYISKVEYRAIKEPDQELDFIIRYYPGEGAKESIARIQGHTYRKRNQKKIEQKQDTPAKLEQGSDAPEATSAALPSATNAQDEKLLQRLIAEFGIASIRAFELIKHHRQSTIEQLEAWSYRSVEIKKGKAGWMIQAIERSYELPPEYLLAKQKEADRQRSLAKHQQIAACTLCDDRGFRFIKAEQYPSGAMRKCSHDPATESQFTATN